MSTDHLFESHERHTMEPDGAMVTIRHNGRPGNERWVDPGMLGDVVVDALRLTGLYSRESGVWTIEARLEADDAR
jgi:hypothetical protein